MIPHQDNPGKGVAFIPDLKNREFPLLLLKRDHNTAKQEKEKWYD